MGIFDFDDKQIDISIRKEIRRWIRAHYRGILKLSKNVNSQGKYEASSCRRIEVIDKSIEHLTNGLFIWTEVREYFDCSRCQNLKSLEGAPRKVGGDFNCNSCISLESLHGAPNEVGGDFDCSGCKNLKTLRGSPKAVGYQFNCDEANIENLDGISQVVHSIRCNFTSIKSLTGAPREIAGDFNCYGCKSLLTLEGAPKYVGGSFDCSRCYTITSLIGAPGRVDGNFRCNDCLSLSSLEGAPSIVGDGLYCSGCIQLNSQSEFKVLPTYNNKHISLQYCSTNIKLNYEHI